jgi:predicted CoA-binding protein
MPHDIDRVLDLPVWAVVGATEDSWKPSCFVTQFLIDRGYDVIPVNPTCGGEIHGRRCFPDLASVDRPVDVVDIFRRSDAAGAHVDEAIAIGAKAVWLQVGVIDQAAAGRAGDAGLLVVMDHCPKVEIPARRRRASQASRAGNLTGVSGNLPGHG